VLTNADLTRMVETSDEWITSRTGIKERRVLREDEATSDIAAEAARLAIDNAGVPPETIDLIICCTFSPDFTVPCTAAIIQDRLGLSGKCQVFDLNSACTGFLYGLSTAIAFLRSGMRERVLVIGVDAVSRSVDFSDRQTCVLFGDGAGAAVLGATGPERGFVSEHHNADGGKHDYIIIYESGTRNRTEEQKLRQGMMLKMRGREVFRFATQWMAESVAAAVEKAGQGLRIEDIDLLIPHQANVRIIESAGKRLGIPPEKVFVNIHRYGNTSAGTIPICLPEAVSEGRLKKGDLLALTAFGGGVTFGASLWIW
jgi:3-oxoacyl-[acyl-carrier-protein] synthase-3